MRKVIILVIILCGVVILAILGTVVSEPSAPESPSSHPEITLVQNSMIAVPADGRVYDWEYKSGGLEGGIAVLVNGSGAYWVKDNTVYAANGTAKTWSPNLDYSPVGIDFNTVKDSATA